MTTRERFLQIANEIDSDDAAALSGGDRDVLRRIASDLRGLFVRPASAQNHAVANVDAPGELAEATKAPASGTHRQHRRDNA